MPKQKITLPKKRVGRPSASPGSSVVSVSALKTAPQTAVAKKKLETTPETLKGFKDILPLDAPYWRHVRNILYGLADSYSFKFIETPILEPLNLFKRTLGKYTDVVEKEMFEFMDKSGGAVALRPEGTAGIARAYINHGMHNLPQPLKVFYDGPMFRYENPQAGRLREHHQIGFEILGSENSVADAQLILIGANLFRELGISFSLQINSIGCRECREVFKEALIEYYKPHRKNLCEDCKRRLSKNPLRLLDCKSPECQEAKDGAPQMIDFLDDACKKHFEQVLEILDELEIFYELNPFLVRGLDYYTKTVFEFWPQGEERAQSSILNGGRYDILIEDMGGQPTPAVGFGLGLERLIARFKEEGAVLPAPVRPDVFIAQLGMEAKKRTMQLFEELRGEGFVVAENFVKDSLKQQLENANKLKAKFALILGQKELQEKSILIRDMDAGVQETVDLKKVLPELRKRMEEKEVVGKGDEEEEGE